MGKKGKNQDTKNKAILKYLNKNDMLLQLPLKSGNKLWLQRFIKMWVIVMAFPENGNHTGDAHPHLYCKGSMYTLGQMYMLEFQTTVGSG